MRDTPLVSVVMSVYNGESDISRSINSILGQTYPNLEFIIIDDGSTDRTAEILEDYARQDNRIKIFNQENQGITKALIYGCAQAQGEYIARQDAGDFSYPERLKKQADLLSSNLNIICCSSWARMLGPKNEILAEIKRPEDYEVATQELLYKKQGPPHHGSVMFQKKTYERIGGYRYQFYFAQDGDLWLRMAQIGFIAYVQEYLYDFKLNYKDISFSYCYIQGKFGKLAQACHRARLRKKNEKKFLDKAEKLRLKRLSYKKYQRENYTINFFIGSCLLKRNDKKAFYYLNQALINCPIYRKGYLGLLILLKSIFYLAIYHKLEDIGKD